MRTQKGLSYGKVIILALLGAAGCLAGAVVAERMLGHVDSGPRTRTPNTPGLVFSQDLERRLRVHGAKTGDVQVSLLWDNFNDLDLHCIDPSGERIYFSNKRARSGGELDVDMNAGGPQSDEPVENIFFPEGRAPRGAYRVYLDYYANHGSSDPTPYRIEVKLKSGVRKFSGQISRTDPTRLIHAFEIAPPVAARTPEPPRRFWYMLAVVSLWTACLAAGLTLALVTGANHFTHEPLFRVRQFAAALGGSLVAGLAAGAVGQSLFALAANYGGIAQIGRAVGWSILGALLGWGLGFFVRQLPRSRAAAAGALGGLLAALAFAVASGATTPTVGRLAGAAILGFLIGLMIAIVEDVAARVQRRWACRRLQPGQTLSGSDLIGWQL